MATANSPAAGEPSAAAQERMDAAYGASERIRNLNKPYAQPMELIFYGEEGRHSRRLWDLSDDDSIALGVCWSEWLVAGDPARKGKATFGESAAGLSAEARAYLDALPGSTLSLYEIQEVCGQEAMVLDLLKEEASPVWAVFDGTVHAFVRWDVAALRLVRMESSLRIADGACPFPRSQGIDLVKDILAARKRDAKRKRPDGPALVAARQIFRTWLDVLTSRSRGKPERPAVPASALKEAPCQCLYAVADWSDLERRLSTRQDIAGGDGHWTWMASCGGGRRVPLACVERKGEMLALTAPSFSLSHAAGSWLHRLAGENGVRLVSGGARDPGLPACLSTEGMTPETRACTFLVWRYLDLLEQRDSDRFFAQPPSYCVQLPSMRNIVIGMLKLWENQEFHARRPSLKTPLDLGILWERLNLFHWPYHVAEEIRLKRRRLEHAPAPAMDAPLFAKLEADSQAFERSCIVGAMAELDLGTFFLSSGNALGAAEAAKALAVDARGLEVLLDALAAAGYFSKHGSGDHASYGVAPGCERLLDSRDPASAVPMLRYRADVLRSWARLSWAVRDGLPQRSHDSFLGRAQDGASSIMAMNAAALRQAEDTMDALEKAALFRGLEGLDPEPKILDIGGASGIYAEAFLRRHPRATATIFDLPAGISQARRRFAGSDLADRIDFIEGDFTKQDFPQKRYHLAWISAVIHQLSREESRKLYAKARDALVRCGLLAVRDYVMDERRITPESGVFFGVNMLVRTRAGRVYTFDEIKEDMKAARLTSVTYAVAAPSMSAVVTARRH